MKRMINYNPWDPGSEMPVEYSGEGEADDPEGELLDRAKGHSYRSELWRGLIALPSRRAERRDRALDGVLQDYFRGAFPEPPPDDLLEGCVDLSSVEYAPTTSDDLL